MISTHSSGRLTPPMSWPRSRMARFTSRSQIA